MPWYCFRRVKLGVDDEDTICHKITGDKDGPSALVARCDHCSWLWMFPRPGSPMCCEYLVNI